MDSTMRGVCYILLLAIFSQECSLAVAKSSLIKLDDNNWDQILTGHWMVEFYAPWCPACQSLQSHWESFATWSEDLSIKVGQVDVTQSPGLSGRFMVTALPTIFHVIDGEFRQYRSSRTKDEFISFIEEDKWAAIEPIPGWKSPSSLVMSLVSYLFKLSMVLRSIHTKLMEEYGLPTWGSYLIFAVATIVMGALLGILLVAVIDHFYPPKPHTGGKSVANKSDSKGKKKKSDDESGGDDDEEEEDAEANEDEEYDENDDNIKDDLEEDESEKNAGSGSGSEETSSVGGSPRVHKRKSRKAD
ncbi:thioredoxin-related transmembrane protein 1-like [Ischnura elegans]|uniref:thioredoxin-related transmembrane protein 1-like n=1 Tax=Ischnura elegans TaxID=197161 RepID=UPI001ED87A8F|nr:thioredoxin-related transmembrane protein 1-like [Ischnura elegans]